MYKKEHLVNGLPVVTEPLRNMRSVVLGLWVKVGSRNEPPEKNGISHFLEHMFFKGPRNGLQKILLSRLIHLVENLMLLHQGKPQHFM